MLPDTKPANVRVTASVTTKDGALIMAWPAGYEDYAPEHVVEALVAAGVGLRLLPRDPAAPEIAISVRREPDFVYQRDPLADYPQPAERGRP